MDKKIICIVGQLGSGKGTAAQYFIKKGYKGYALRDRLREEMEKAGVELTRTNMQDFADNLRKKLGNDIYAVKTDELITKNGAHDVVIESFRNPGEVEYFKNKYGAKVIGIIATPEKRFSNMLGRGRLGDPKTWEEFQKVETRDKGIGQAVNGQQSDACLKLADVVLENNGTKADLYEKLSRLREGKLLS